MRVSYFYGASLPSSASAPIQILHTCRALAAQGVHVEVHSGPHRGAVLQHYGIEHHSRLRLIAHRGAAAMLEALRARDGHVIARGRPMLQLLWLCGAHDAIVEAHRLDYTDKPSALRQPTGIARVRFARERAVLSQARGIVFLTKALADVVDDVFHVACPRIVLPSAAVSSQVEHVPRDIDVLYAGKLRDNKGIADVVRAMEHVQGTLTIVGDGPARRTLEKLASRNVRFVGAVPHRDMPAWWVRARVGVCTLPAGESLVSERFTSPLKVMEMMAAGVPIVATDVPSIREILVDGESALLAPPGDARAIGERIGALLRDRALADRIAARAREMVTTFEARARALVGFLESLE